MEDLDRFEQLLKQRSFISLNDEERNFVFQFIGSEQEYESLRMAEVELKRFIEMKTDLHPRKETWRKIKQSRAEKIISVKPFWLRPSVPGYAVALLIIFVGVMGWWSGARFGSEKTIVEKIVPRIDTIRIATTPDTVIKDRIIYLPITSPKLVSAESPRSERLENKGVNMKDKEELEGLLVSGSY